jgi:hypothetical protein
MTSCSPGSPGNACTGPATPSTVSPANAAPHPSVHRVASLVQRWILGTHQGAISHDQLDYYLDELTFRFNRRRPRHRGLLFYRLLEGAATTDPHPYTALTSRSGA